MLSFEALPVMREHAERLCGIRALFTEYNNFLLSVGCDVSLFQGFPEELAGLPGKYEPPSGTLILLRQMESLSDASTDAIHVFSVQDNRNSHQSGQSEGPNMLVRYF
eukprot:c13590_g1_i1.p1 GENE.c13590_g1_i1~~c13590_g1_i1.p1  ORF type:complete len:107 (-),score=6.50 c13590_g1_i1:82-402(-)